MFAMSIKSLSLLCALSHLSLGLFNIPIFMIENCKLAQHSEVENKIIQELGHRLNKVLLIPLLAHCL